MNRTNNSVSSGVMEGGIKSSSVKRPNTTSIQKSNFLQVPTKKFRLSAINSGNQSEDDFYETSDCDSVFSESEEHSKENSRRSRRYGSRNGRKFGTSPPSPGPAWDRGFCLDSPTRKSLQRDATFLPQTIRKLGRGGFGTVVLGTWQSRRVAVKILSLRDQLIFDREVAASDRLDHPNIVKVLTIFKGTDEMTNSLLVMEYVGHYNLMAVIQSQPEKLTQPFIVKACIQLSQALDHCHKRGVYHLDVKPANVLVIKDRGSPVFKLADFGCSTTETRLDQVVGTPGYQAPETFRRVASDKSDVYSFGVTLWQLLSKQTIVYPDMHQHTIIFKVASSPDFNPESASKRHLSLPNSKLTEMYRQCWSFTPEERPSFQEILAALTSLKRPSLSVGCHVSSSSSVSHNRRNSSLRI